VIAGFGFQKSKGLLALRELENFKKDL